jgi:2-dehydro-3-deoxyphosphogluconate aldolase/(4S)-4-hydroxy-2-oxoglutarate aldolase
VSAGFHSLEVALTTPAAITTLTSASQALPEFNFGVGTVLDVDTARLAVLAGAKFIVTPAPRPEVITLCRRYHVPVISGAYTLEDIVAAHRAGADAVKLYPGELFGPAYIKSVLSSAPRIPLIPVGGVTAATVTEFIRAGALATFAGSSLIDDQTVGQRAWSTVAQRAREFQSQLSTLVDAGQ